MKFSIDLETYFPIFDKNSQFFKGNSIQDILSSSAVSRDENGDIIFTESGVSIKVDKKDYNDLVNSYNSDDSENLTQNNDAES